MMKLLPSSEDLRIYEIAVLYPTDLSQKDEHTLFQEIDELFQEAGSKTLLKDSWGQRGLAFPISGHREGKYVIFYIESDPSRVKALDLSLRILKGILRHLVVKPPEGYEPPLFAEKYTQWLKDRAAEADTEKREREEQFQKRILERAREQAKRTERKRVVPPKTDKESPGIDEQIDRIISDEDLKL